MSNDLKWKHSAKVRRRGLTAKAIGAELKRIKMANAGVLDPEHVVNAARKSRSPLHSMFIWDDTEAARLFRLRQARDIIVAVVVYSSGSRESRRLYAAVTTSRGRGYVTLAEAMSDEAMRAELVNEAIAAIRAWRSRYSELKELAGLVEVIDERLPRATKSKRKAA